MAGKKGCSGRKLMFESPEELEKKIHEYFVECPDKKTIRVTTYNSKGRKETSIQEVAHPTISGIALHLGFESRQSFHDYEKRPIFSYIIKRARLFIEREYEMRLKENPAGAIFALKNLGWKDNPVINVDHSHHLTTEIHVEGKKYGELIGHIRDRLSYNPTGKR